MAGNVGLELASKFHAVFAGMSQAYGTYDLSRPQIRESDGKVEGGALTRRAPVTDELWQKHLDGEMGIGIVPIRDDNTCLFGAIDVDDYSGLSHQDMAVRLARLGIPLVVFRSKSGGLHLFAFASEPVSALKMQTKLRDVAAVLGHGTSEIFPKQTKILIDQGDVGQWINMPYFNGVRGMRYAVTVEGNAMSAWEFLSYVDEIKQGPAWFDSPTLLVNDFPDGPPCLQILSNIGYPKGTRNDGLYSIGIYLRKSDPDNWEQKLDILNHKYMVPPLSLIEVQGVAKSLKRKEYNYACTKQPICNHCNATLCRTRKYGVGGGQGKFPSLGGLTKLATKPPTWFWTVDGIRMELTTTDLQDPRKFQARCMEYLNMMPPMPSAPIWQSAVQHAMDSVTVVEAPSDASPEGQFWEMVEKFCTGRAQALQKEEIVLGRPFTQGKKTYFRLIDLVTFLNTHKFVDFKTVKIAAMLKESGAEHHVDAFKGRTTNYWSIPALVGQSESFDVPDSMGGKPAF